MTKSKSSTKTHRLSDTQLVILSAASQADSRSAWPVPNSITAAPGSIRKTIKRLIANGMLAETPATKECPVWREDGDLSVGIAITEAGMAALGLSVGSESSTSDQPATDEAASENTQLGASEAGNNNTSDDRAGLPRPGTKLGAVLELLKNKKGASIETMMDATGWQAHSVRAAMTGLRKRGIAIERSKSKDGQTVYMTAAN